jgi:hypothetical protein
MTAVASKLETAIVSSSKETSMLTQALSEKVFHEISVYS